MNSNAAEMACSRNQDFVRDVFEYIRGESTLLPHHIMQLQNALEPLIESEYELGRTAVIPVSKLDMKLKGGLPPIGFDAEIERHKQCMQIAKRRLASMECAKYGKASFDPDSSNDDGWIDVALKYFPDVDLFEGIDWPEMTALRSEIGVEATNVTHENELSGVLPVPERDFVLYVVNYIFYKSLLSGTEKFRLLTALESLIESEYDVGKTNVIPLSRLSGWKKCQAKRSHETDLSVEIVQYEQRLVRMKHRLAEMERNTTGSISFDPDSPYDERWIEVAKEYFKDVDLFDGIE